MTRKRWCWLAGWVALFAAWLSPTAGVGAEPPANRLAASSSPYLLQHRFNPVDWYPWGEEAMTRARREDKPIFLSIGYATCYWCHVMERESFSDPAIAAFLNEHFVSIKVDREQRPDLDEIYMTATQLVTGRGGWPNSVFLTPDGKPFYAGTYFPPYDVRTSSGGVQPGFFTILGQLRDGWVSRREQVEAGAEALTRGVQRVLEASWKVSASEGGDASESGEGTIPEAAVAVESLRTLASRFDAEHGGFASPQAGYQPKFPSPSSLLLLLELRDADPERLDGFDVETMLWRTLDAMAGGGLHDERGGFHRYATRRDWSEPHYEKMLYDNGWLLEVYARAAADNPVYRSVARQTAAFLARELTGPRGELWSAVYGRAPSEEHPGPSTRPDDKVLTDWNGVAIAGLATAGRVLGEPELVRQASRAAEFVLDELSGDTRDPQHQVLRHAWRAGSAEISAMLGDYAYFVRGLLALHAATGELRWLQAARGLTDEQIERLRAPTGGFFLSVQADVLFRSQDPHDGPMPSANGVAILNLLELHRRTGEDRWRREAEQALAAFGRRIRDNPAGLRTLSLAVWRYRQQVPESQSLGTADATATPASSTTRLQEEALRVVRNVDFRLAEAGDDGWSAFELRWRVADGWHLNANPASLDFLVPTTLAGQSEAVELEVDYPPGALKGPLRVYQGDLVLTGRVRTTENQESRLSLTYQACQADRCLPPVRWTMTPSSRP